MLRAHPYAGKTSHKWSSPPSPESNSPEYHQENEARYNAFRVNWINRLKILSPSISGRDLNIMVFHQSVYLDEKASINPTYLLLSMKYRNKAPGIVCHQWLAVQHHLKDRHIPFIYDRFKLGMFEAGISNGRLRVIVLLDDLLFYKDTAFFTRNQCNFCKRERSHMTWVCPLYPTEELRAALLRSEDRCTGCAQTGCGLGRRNHPHRIIGGCRQCESTNDHVSWRCASFTREQQMIDQTNRYLFFLQATWYWPDQYFEKLLRDVCAYYVIPYPDDIFDD